MWISLQDLGAIERCFDWWENLDDDTRNSPAGEAIYNALQSRLKHMVGKTQIPMASEN